MKSYIYIPPSLRAAGKHVRYAGSVQMKALSKHDFLQAWCSVAYLYPGLHPDGYLEKDNGWPRVLQRFAAEAWRRFKAGQLTDNELYCYQASKARITRELKAVENQKS